MNSDSPLIFIYDLLTNGISIWIQDGIIQLFVPDKACFTEEQQNYIKLHKNEIFDHLQNNKVYSKSSSLLILKHRFKKTILSFAQDRLWFIEKYEEGTNAYNVPMTFKLSNNVKLDILEKSVRSMVTRHEILRTLIKEDSEGTGYQVVINDQECPLKITKINVIDRLQLDQELEKAVNYIYDLTKEYPIRICLYVLNNSTQTKDVNRDIEYYLSVVIHHIAFDGWSIDIFLRELQEYYNYYLEQSQGLKSNIELPDLNIQYKDFALWQRHYVSGERLARQLEYWKKMLADYEPLNLITDKPRPSQIDYQGLDVYFKLDEDTSNGLRELAKELKVSLYSVLLSGYYLMLRSYTNQDDIIIGSPVANRHYSQIENLIGFFVNSLVLRVKIDSKVSVKAFIQKVGDEVIAAQLHQDLPFEKLVEELKVVKDTSRHPIFQIMFAVQKFGNELYNKAKAKNDPVNLLQKYVTTTLYKVARFDINTFIDDSESTLKGIFNYAVNLYTKTTISGFIETYIGILKQLAEIAYDKKQAKVRIAELNYLDVKQHQQIIYDWNNTDKDYPNNKTVHQLFEEQVERTPDNMAVICGETKLTYRELNYRANQLANYLKQIHDIKPDTLVALCLDKSEHVLIAILAVLKAGGAYVPIPPCYPDDRIHYTITDTNTKVVLTHEIHKLKLEGLNKQHIEILTIDSRELQEQLSLQSISNPNTKIKSTDLAYVMYTSGTTGNPKGVMIEHRSVINYIFNIKLYNLILPEDKVDFSTNVGFDLTITTTICSLCFGSQVLVYNAQLQNLEVYKHHLSKSNVNVIKLVPSYFELLIDYLPSTKVNKIILGGEKLNFNIINKLRDLYSNQKNSFNLIIWDEYGTTETTVGTCNSQICLDTNLTIGKPYYNYKVYVLDSNVIPLPIGGIGELYIGGVGLARGYLNQPELTNEKFVTNPFQTEEEKAKHKNARLYKTGDLVRWLPDGNLEYIGRNDFQVNIRGYRIELGEIENVLSTYSGIKQSIVIAKERKNIKEGSVDNKYLIGYYVSDSKLDEEGIVSYLQKKLLEYMIPSLLVHLEELPLTINGKLDRKALPEPEFSSGNNYVAPRNELEKQVCEIWAGVLGLDVDKVGIRDDFFRLGGNSIIAIRLVSKLNSDIALSSIFKYRTVQELAHYLKHNTEDKLNNPRL